MFTTVNRSIYDDNLGTVDRILRVVTSVALIGTFMAFQEAGTVIYSLLALIAMPIAATALMSWDPLYAVLGINSRGKGVNPQFGEQNVGRVDSYVRYAVSAALVLGFMLLAPTPVGLSALLPLLAVPIFNTALTGWCPIYTLLQISSRPVDGDHKPGAIVYAGFPEVSQPERTEDSRKKAA